MRIDEGLEACEMTEMERLARLLCHCVLFTQKLLPVPQEAVDAQWRAFVPHTRTLLEALKEPTEDMLGMGSDEICKVFPYCKCPGDENGASDMHCYPAARASWQAMISTILNEKDDDEKIERGNDN